MRTPSNDSAWPVRRVAALAVALATGLVVAACGGSQPEDIVSATGVPLLGGATEAATTAGNAAATLDDTTTAVPDASTTGAPDSAGAPAGATGPASAPSGGTAAPTASASAGTSGAKQGAKKSAGQAAATGAPAGGAPAPGQPAVPAPGTPGGSPGAPQDNGGATDVGVSATEIKLGSISGNNTPLGNLISSPVTTAVFATMRSVNDSGGVFGRKLNIIDCDDSGDVTRFRACYKKLIAEEKIFSFITSVTWGTGEVHGDLDRDKIPWIGSWGFYTSEWKDPWMFPVHLATVHEAHVAATWARDVIKPKTVGILYLNTPEQQLAKNALHQVLDPAGIKVVREIPQEIDTPDESSNVLSMRSANPDFIIHFAWPPPIIKFMVDAAQQGYWPPMGMMGNHFLGEQIGRLVGEWPLQGMWSVTSYKIWGPEYLAIMDKYAPQMRKLNHHNTQSGYIGVKIFADAAKALGPNLTREGIMKVLESRRWDMGPGLGQSVLWSPGNHDTMRCEYVFKYNSTETGSNKVFVPDPTKFEACETVD